MGSIEALYIFDEHNNTVLEHVYTGRPPFAEALLSQFLTASEPRPSLMYLSNTIPPALLFNVLQDRLLFFATCSGELDPLQGLAFLHRVIDALEEFLGSPLLSSKLEANYDVVTQIVGEVCDAGMACNTEPNALREVVEIPNWMGNLLSGIQTPSLQTPGTAFSNFSTFGPTPTAAVPWRRANVRHTSNELYVDIVEKLSVVIAPSGRPISAFANGMIAFNAKISGVPDLSLRLSAPGGPAGIQKAMDLPSFHQCVRLARWREQPGELSFVPPDGRFILAGYQHDLLSDISDASDSTTMRPPSMVLPASLEMLTGQGTKASELDVRLTLPLRGSAGSPSSISGGSLATKPLSTVVKPGINTTNGFSGAGAPPLEDIVVSIPISTKVRNVTDIRCSRGEANFSPAEASLEWRISTREAALLGASGATMSCTIVGLVDNSLEGIGLANGMQLKTDTFDYDETVDGAFGIVGKQPNSFTETGQIDTNEAQPNSPPMPTEATLSFAVRGWLASGIKVDSLTVNARTSKGLGAGVTPYKGVKYHTISQRGVEVRG